MSGDGDKVMDRYEREAAMPDPARMEVLIEAMTPPGPDHLQGLEQEALSAGVPIIRPQTQNLIRFFLAVKRPSRILEIGTAVGFSALFMQHYAPAGCRIITIEKDPGRAEQARGNFRKFGKGEESGRENIVLMEGDAAQLLREIREDASFDMLFMDAAKGQYIRFLPDAIRLLAPGGIMITDYARLYPRADGGGAAGDPAASHRRRRGGFHEERESVKTADQNSTAVLRTFGHNTFTDRGS